MSETPELDAASEEERQPIILAVHNDQVVDGVPQFIQYHYGVPLSVMLQVQRLLEPHQLGPARW